MTMHATPPPATTDQPLRVSRSRAMRHLLTPALLQESLAVRRPASLRDGAIAGLQTALATALIAALLHLSPWPHLIGFAALGALAALFGRTETRQRRRDLVLSAGMLLVAPVAVLSLLTLAGTSTPVMLVALAIAAGLLAAATQGLQLGAPGVVIFVFAASAALGPLHTLHGAIERPLATALGVAAAWLTCLLTDRARDNGSRCADAPAQAQAAAAPATGPSVPATRQALRVAICAAIASLLAHAAGWQHPEWAGIGAIAIVQGLHLPGTVHRAWQRSFGTIVGAGIAWAILSTLPSFWQILLAVAILQCVTEMVIGLNYALGQIAVTPMALLMTTLSAPTEASTMALSRIADTILGAVVGIVLVVLLSTLDERRHLARHRERLRSAKS